MKGPGNVIINSPFEPPCRHWQPQRDGTLTLVEERRPASDEIYDVRNNTRRVETLDQVNEIRQRIERWRADDYPGITAVRNVGWIESGTSWHCARRITGKRTMAVDECRGRCSSWNRSRRCHRSRLESRQALRRDIRWPYRADRGCCRRERRQVPDL
jgi:hypothetical protein